MGVPNDLIIDRRDYAVQGRWFRSYDWNDHTHDAITTPTRNTMHESVTPTTAIHNINLALLRWDCGACITTPELAFVRECIRGMTRRAQPF